jgi:type I restriction enzyme S subunit
MELMTKQGYKQTEVGLIPEDWETKSISEISNPVRGGSPRPAGSPKYFNGDFIPWLTVASLTNIPNSQIFVNETKSFLTEAGSHLSRKLEKGTLIIANSGATLGVAKLLGIRCCANDGVAALQDINKNIYPIYLVYYINTITKRLREDIATGNGQPNLNTELIGNIKIPLPPTLTEQKAIATALSDVDALISSLEQGITKKKAIKQGVMQELLTPPHKGGKRLPGFSEEWNEIRLGDLIHDFQNGYAFSAIGYEDFGIRIITMAQIGLQGQFQFNESKGNYWDVSQLKPLKDFVLKKGDLIMSMTDVTPQKNLIGRMTIIEEKGPFFLNQRVGHLRVNKEKANTVILKHLSNMRSWRTYSKGIASLGVQANIGTTDIKNGTFNLPQIEEQNAIAQILSDMDAEITQLETKKEKYQAIKQGMMQELLTGKTRLV